MSFWKHTREVIFERGVGLDRDAHDGWRFHVGTDLPAPQPENMLSEFGIRPIWAKCRSLGTDTEYSVVFPAATGRFLDVRRANLQQLVYKRGDVGWFRATQSLFFLLEAATYHCERLAIVYRDELRAYSRLSFLHDADRTRIQCQRPFYEFDALTTVVIRALDSTRYLIWKTFGDSGSVPSSLPHTLKKVKGLPDGLTQRLNDMWTAKFSHTKEYRDCIQHYVAVGSGSWAMINRVANDVRGLMVPIPDNPEAKSSGEFRFSKDYDALTYAWELTNALFETVEMIIQAACTHAEDGTVQDISME